MNLDIIAQGVGILAGAILVASYAVRSDRHLKIIMATSASVFCVHYYLLAEPAGVAVKIIDFLRVLFSIKIYKPSVFIVIFVTAYIVFGALTYEKFVDVLPIIASILGTISMYKLTGVKFRVVLLFVCALWLIYSFSVFSIGGIMTNILLLTMNGITIYRLRQ